MATRNRTDLEQVRQDYERLRQDASMGANVLLSGFQDETGATRAVPGDVVPWSRNPPFPQPTEQFGQSTLVPTVGFTNQELATNHADAQAAWPILNVEEWRTITLSIFYDPPAAGGILSMIPRYASAGGGLLALGVLGANAVVLQPPFPSPQPTDYFSYTIRPQEFRTQSSVNGSVIAFQLKLDVSSATQFSMTACEVNPLFIPPQASTIGVFYSLSA